MGAVDGGQVQDSLDEFPVPSEDVLARRQVSDTLEDGDVIDCGGTQVEILHTPGHTAGHCSVFLPEEEILFAGDICLTAAGPCYADPDADIDQLMDSIDRLIALKPGTLVTSHSKQVYNGSSAEVLAEFRDRILTREERIFSAVRKQPSDIHGLAGRGLVYSMYPNVFVLFWEKCMLEKHLLRMERAGVVKVSEEESGIWFSGCRFSKYTKQIVSGGVFGSRRSASLVACSVVLKK